MKCNVLNLLKSLFIITHLRNVCFGRVNNELYNNYYYLDDTKKAIKTNKVNGGLTIKTTVTKRCLPSCEDYLEYTLYEKKTNCNMCNNYCIDKNNHIYGISIVNKCLINFHDIHLFEFNNSDQNRMINLYNDEIINPSNLCIYQCDDQCIQTSGYVKIDNQLSKNSMYYYVNPYESKIIKPTNITDITECSSHIGELVKIQNNVNYYEMCITDNLSIPLDFYYGDIITSGTMSSKSPFLNNKNNSNVVITYDYNYIIAETHFNFYNGYLLISSKNYLQCDQDGCNIKTKFVDSCDDKNNTGKLAKIGKEGFEKIYICSNQYDDNKIEIPFDNYYKNDDLNMKLYESFYIIEKNFPGTIENSKTFTSIWFNNIYCNIGLNLNTEIDATGKTYISSIIYKCYINEDNMYICDEEKAIQGDYYYDHNTYLIYKVESENKMKEENSLDGFYVNQNEYFFYKNNEPWYNIGIDEIEKDFDFLCLFKSIKIELSNENSGQYLLYVPVTHPYPQENDSYRVITISHNKAVFNMPNEAVSYCLDNNFKLTVKENSCYGKETKCQDGICTKPTDSIDIINNALILHISPFIILISILLSITIYYI
ncbi:hypothetical protein BCR36DRAFT_409215 [Piromyces finnis]|uniref:Apple domain-containing protein n=1 Tax=Piromyces finnis TaxID=1754191 RepID=A0A1Y1VKV4_9FUNG|nr:hypothetical protein BCR36DRAFT_409215 [Piromyces finnis]|eukprot:ORX57736.1 hypothetical protein BCR36DRAFT_409215 [Piromyces finnis]